MNKKNRYGNIVGTFWIPEIFNEGFQSTGVIYQLEKIDDEGCCRLKRIAVENGKFVDQRKNAAPECYLLQADVVSSQKKLVSINVRKVHSHVIKYKIIDDTIINFVEEHTGTIAANQYLTV